MNRKTFLQQSGILLAGSLVSGPAAPASWQTELVLGQNEKRYRFNNKWVQAQPDALPVKDCHEMVQDSSGNIVLLTNDTRNNLIFFDKNGRVLRTCGRDFPGAHGLSRAGSGNDAFFMVTDTERRQFFKLTTEGRVIQEWQYPAESGVYTEAAQFVPTETAITESGDFYVADGYGAQYILHYDAAGRLLNSFGGRGTEDKHLDNAHGICIDNRTSPATLLVTDRTRCCFKRFSLNGSYMETIALPGACVCRPVIRGDYLYAAVLRSPSLDAANTGFVIILNKDNKVVSVLGGAEPVYKNGEPLAFYQTIQAFKHPHDVLVDDEENLYVCQWNAGQLYPFKCTPLV